MTAAPARAPARAPGRRRARRTYRREVRIDHLEREAGMPALGARPGDCGRHCRDCCRCAFCDREWARFERAMWAGGVGVCRVPCREAPPWWGPDDPLPTATLHPLGRPRT